MVVTMKRMPTYLLLCAGNALFALMGAAAEIPQGTQISVRTLDSIQSKQSEVGQNYRCTLNAAVESSGQEIVPKGADCVLRIVEMKEAGKLKGNNELQLVVSEIRIRGKLVPVNSQPTAITGKGKGKSTGVRTGIGAGVGAGLGALIGGGKGAAIGAGVGAGAGAASSALTHGPEIKVAPETVLMFTIQ